MQKYAVRTLLVSVLSLVLSSAFGAKTEAESATDPRQVGNVPPMQARLKLNGHHFEQSVRIQFPIAVSLHDIREHALGGELMMQLSDWVANAGFNLSAQGEATALSLTIGKMGMNFTHTFSCRETREDFAWGIECSQSAGDPKSKVVLQGAKRSVFCQASGGLNEATICDFKMSGVATDIGMMLSSVSGSEVAFTLFVEDTRYLAQLSLLIAARALSPSHAGALFAKSQYAILIQDLISQAPNFDRMPGEVLVTSATSPEDGEQLAVR